MSIQCGLPTVWELLTEAYNLLTGPVVYATSSKSFADSLKQEVRKLENEAERVHVLEMGAERNVRKLYGAFTDWKASAEEASKDARELLDAFDKATKTCCYGTLPDPKCRYQFSTKAEAQIKVVRELAQQCIDRFKELNDISFIDNAPGEVAVPNPAKRVQSPTAMASVFSASTSIKTREDGLFESRALMIQKVMDALANTRNSVVGIYGMGGVGKSTLLVDVERRIRKENSFDWVAMVDVSENPDIKRIQAEIAHGLGLSDIKKEENVSLRAKLLHKRLEDEGRTEEGNDEERKKKKKNLQGEIAHGLGLSDIKKEENASLRAKLLHKRLEDEGRTEEGNDEERKKKKKKVLIILDSLWEGVDLKSIGIPCGGDNKVKGCKLLLTSRHLNVLQREMGCDKAFHLGGLQEEEARALFERVVGDKVHDDEFKPWVEIALRRCAGVPFLIVAMAKRFKNAELFEWKDALKKMEKFVDKENNKLIHHMLQWSYDNLEEETKSLLRLCVVYGVSQPSLENLVRYGFGLGLFQQVGSLEEATDRLHSHIRALQASALLLDSEDVGSFKIHDLVREFVASIASRDHHFLVLKEKDKLAIEWSKDKLKSCRAICFPYVDMKELPKEIDCPELQMFLLFANNESLDVSDSYFNSTRKLAVLNLIGIHLIHSPLSFHLLENLNTLCLDGCSLEDVSSLGNLKGLQILSFLNSKIHRLPKEIGQLVELRLLDLNNCSWLQVIEPGVLGSLIKLEELYVENSFDRWNAMEQTPPSNACLIELNNMKNLCTLHVSIPDPSVLPGDLNLQKLTKYRIQIGSTWHWSSEHNTSTALKLKLNPKKDILQKGCVRTTLDKTEDLYLDGLNKPKSICELSVEGFPKLKHLHVENSPSIHYILQRPSHTAFKRLESLILEDLINMEKICHSHIFSTSFRTLKVVRVKHCHKMEVLFPLSLLRELPQLEEIGVIHCDLMRGIAEADECGKVELCNLHVLELRDLPSIKNFLTDGRAPLGSSLDNQVDTQALFFNGQQVSIPSLQTLTMSGLPNLENIWSDESPLELSNLQSLELEEYKSLSSVFNCRLLANSHKLHTLTIKDCVSVQEVFDLERPSASGNVETLSELTILELWFLPSLRNIWNKNPRGIVTFHRLTKLEVFGCDSLRFLFFASMVKSLAQLRELRVRYCKKMEVIIMEEEGMEMETLEILAFPMLTYLQLSLESLTYFSRKECSRETRSEDHVKSRSTVLFNQEVAFPHLETLDIKDMNNIEMIWDNQVATDSFQNLKSLEVWDCNKLVSIVPSCILGWLRRLESLKVYDCRSLEVVFELQSLNPLDGNLVGHSQLRGLKLHELPKLKCVWDNELHCQVKFQCLHSVSVFNCKSLTSLFPASVAKDLIQLEELEINACGIAELIEMEGQGVGVTVFPKLTSLKLECLTELKCICTGTHALGWPSLKTLEVNGCNKVEILTSQTENEMPLQKQPLFLLEKGAFPNLQELRLDLSGQMEIWHGHFHDEEFFCRLRVLELRYLSKECAISTWLFIQSLTNLEKLVLCESHLEELSINVEAIEGPGHELLPLSRHFQQLKTLEVSCCDGLSSMFTPTTAKNLVKLTELRIKNCKMLKEVISDEGGKEGCVVTFNQLKHMHLDGLTGLRSFSSSDCTLMFPLLKDVIVSKCPNMKSFSEGPIVAPKLERILVQTQVDAKPQHEVWFWKENLNTTIQNMFEEMAMIAGVKFMWLSEFPDLIGKWHGELNPIKSSWQLESLVVDNCPSFVNAIPSKLMLVLEKMRSLNVHNCESLEEIFDLEGLGLVESTRVLPQLQYLGLVNLPKLRQLWNKDLQGTMRFSSLYHLTLYNCNNLRYAFVPSMARCLANLHWIEIKKCGQMEGVIAEEKEQGSAVEKISFSRLYVMKLECLPNLTSFLSGKNHTLDCPFLIELTIAHCPKMRSLAWHSWMEIDHGIASLFTPQVQFPQLEEIVLSHMDSLSKIWSYGLQGTSTFKYLLKVEARDCKNLEILFPHWAATSLTQLEKLRVESCGLEEIVSSASGDDSPHSIATQFLFPGLTSLVLHDMPQLKSFCPSLLTLNWPFLKELRVTHCDKLNILSFVVFMSKWAQRDDQHDLSDHEAHFSVEKDIPTLERLLLVDKDIQMIQNGKFTDDIGKSKALTLACFHDERAVFPSSFLLERFPNLKSLEVFCSSFEDIFPDEGLVDEGKHSALDNLREFKLSKLHKLKRVWREEYVITKVLQSIETFEVWDCPGLTALFPAIASFQNLTELVVRNSSGLVHLVTALAVTNLVHLTDMTIIGCERMKEVVANDENGEKKVISFGKLKSLTLQDMPSLECFSSTTSYIFRFPSLEYIVVEECPKMNIFSKGTLSMPKLEYARLFRYEWHWNWEGDLNTTIQKLSA